MQFYQLLDYCVKQLGSGGQVKLVKLDQGAINQSYCLYIDQSKYMVKQFVGNSWLPTKRTSTKELQSELALLGIAPMPIHLSDKQDIYIEQWCPFVPFAKDDNDLEACVDVLANALIHIHHTQRQSNAGPQTQDIPSHWRKYLKYIHDPDKKWRRQAKEYAQVWRDYELRFSQDFTLCHNDLSLSHVDHLSHRYIDWEYAGKGCRFFDLIACCLANAFDQNACDALIRRYIELSDYHREEVYQRVKVLKPLVIFTHQLWWQANNAQVKK